MLKLINNALFTAHMGKLERIKEFENLSKDYAPQLRELTTRNRHQLGDKIAEIIEHDDTFWRAIQKKSDSMIHDQLTCKVLGINYSKLSNQDMLKSYYVAYLFFEKKDRKFMDAYLED
jgi:hypothetical protein